MSFLDRLLGISTAVPPVQELSIWSLLSEAQSLAEMQSKTSRIRDTNTGRLLQFDHDSRFLGGSVEDRDLAMVAQMIGDDLKREGFSHVSWTVHSKTTSLNCLGPDGETHRIHIPTPIQPQITATKLNQKCGVHIKLSRDLDIPPAWTSDEISALRSDAIKNCYHLFLASVTVIVPLNSVPPTTAGFGIDYRGLIFVF